MNHCWQYKLQYLLERSRGSVGQMRMAAGHAVTCDLWEYMDSELAAILMLYWPDEISSLQPMFP